MNYIIRCFCLFDITHTGVLNRSRPPIDIDEKSWVYKRNTQCNYDTLLQAISIRSQPEIISHPIVKKVNLTKIGYFGKNYRATKKEMISCWSFEFGIQHPSVFNDGVSDLGSLYSDCDNVPMILCGTEFGDLSNFLSSSLDYKNIHFEALK